jgi:DNA gyrase subunit A
VQGRGGKGRRAYRINNKTGELKAAKLVSTSHTLMLLSLQGVILRVPMNSLAIQGRHTQGVIVMRLDAGDRVIATSFLEEEDKPKLSPTPKKLPGDGSSSA